MEKSTSNKDHHKNQEQSNKHDPAEFGSGKTVSGTSAIQKMIDRSPQVQKGRKIQSDINNSTLMVAQLRKKEALFGGPIQKKNKEEEKPLQKKEVNNTQVPENTTGKNNSGLPDQLKTSMESISGFDLSDVNVHFNSAKPSLLNAHAYAQGTDIHIATGQEKHLPHEAWHVVQQKQGKVQPTVQMKGVQVNDSVHLEKEADEMGAKANSGTIQKKENAATGENLKYNKTGVVQRWGMDNAPYGDPKRDPKLLNMTTQSEKEKVAEALKSRDAADVKKIQDVTAASNSERIELIKILVYQGWVGPLDEYKIQELWKSFGTDEYKFRDANQKLFDDSIIAGAELYTVDRDASERSAWLSFFSHYLPKKFINNYMDGLAAPITLSQQEMIDCNPIVDVRRSPLFTSTLASLQASGGGTKAFEFSQPSGALTNGTLGNFSIKFKGSLTVQADGTWTFTGSMTFYDYWDFDPKPFSTGGRSVQGEIKTRAGAYLLRGKPFDIFSVAAPITQSDKDSEGVWGGGATAVPVADKAAKPLGTDLKDL